ncbi:MAG: 3-oxoacyl-ACP synthase [Chitinophagales bacterium]|nr:MAG: 3-oxoacyl-ACP synthase [Chitinophagales bacterium]
MSVFINGVGMVSPQLTTGGQFLNAVVEREDIKLLCTEPDYSTWFDARQLRRMSRLTRISLTAAVECIREAGIDSPDAIVTGTGLGCMQDSAAFLRQMIRQHEEALSPTPFIQSTHNTISAAIALYLKAHAYNLTCSHRGFSLESALTDALMMLSEGKNHILTGAYDEIIEDSFVIQQRMNLYKKRSILNTRLFADATEGTIAGEGAAFFMLSNTSGSHCYARLLAVETLYKPADVQQVHDYIPHLLNRNKLSPDDIDLLLLGKNGDARHEDFYHQAAAALPLSGKAAFKHLCGEFPSASGFALWLGCQIMRNQTVPEVVQLTPFEKKEIKHLLLYNHYKKINHAFILLAAC